jgi:hypothetical protein
LSASNWITLVAAIFGSGGISALGGYLLSGRNERKRDDRQEDRERRGTREKQGDEARTFQRDTLLELHDLLYKLNRNAGASQHIDEMRYRSTGLYGRDLLPEELSDGFTFLITSINKLRVRIFDPELRTLIEQYTNAVIAVASADSNRKEGDDAAVAAKAAKLERETLNFVRTSAREDRCRYTIAVSGQRHFAFGSASDGDRREVARFITPAQRS